MKHFLLLLPLTAILACQEPAPPAPAPPDFSAASLRIPDAGARKIRGQVLYMPVYSEVPMNEGKSFPLSAVLAVHNTDLANSIRITRVILFNTQGKPVQDYLPQPRPLEPMSAAVFLVPRSDASGTGANFLVEWISEKPVTEPLVESIMKDLNGNLGLSFLSHGRVIREIP